MLVECKFKMNISLSLQGQLNLGHDIPELLAVTTSNDDSVSTNIPSSVTSPQAAFNLTSSTIRLTSTTTTFDSIMTPIDSSHTRMGKRTAIGIDVLLLVIGMYC